MVKQEGTATIPDYTGVTNADHQPFGVEKKYEKTFELARTRHTAVCPIRDIVARLSDKWSMLAILALGSFGKLRFNQIKGKIGDVSQRMLTLTLRNLENNGLITRHVYAELPPKVEYDLTPLGRSLLNQYQHFTEWAELNMEDILAARKSK